MQTLATCHHHLALTLLWTILRRHISELSAVSLVDWDDIADRKYCRHNFCDHTSLSLSSRFCGRARRCIQDGMSSQMLAVRDIIHSWSQWACSLLPKCMFASEHSIQSVHQADASWGTIPDNLSKKIIRNVMKFIVGISTLWNDTNNTRASSRTPFYTNVTEYNFRQNTVVSWMRQTTISCIMLLCIKCGRQPFLAQYPLVQVWRRISSMHCMILPHEEIEVFEKPCALTFTWK